MPNLPDCLYHYYEKRKGPFTSLSDLSLEQAETILEGIRKKGQVFASQRQANYLAIRRELEQAVRQRFIDKGGQPQRKSPHYMILGASPWVLGWYEEGCEVCIPLKSVSPQAISFTYGDSFPAMRFQDGKPYRGQVYTLSELPGILEQYGLPQEWNPDGRFGPERYIEAQLWDDGPVKEYLIQK